MKYLSTPDLNLTLDIIHSSLDCTSDTQFSALIDQLHPLAGISYARSMFSNKPPENLHIDKMLTTFPEEWEKYYAEQNYFYTDNVVHQAVHANGISSWQDCQNLPNLTTKRNKQSQRVLDEAAAIGMKNGWLYSCHNQKKRHFTVLSFASEDRYSHRKAEIMLEYLSPHLEEALKRTENQRRTTPRSLTVREKEVLSWTAAGKTAWEISEILLISRRTVEFHISNILKKLDAVNSQQAIAVALSSGLISY